jgi:hypothetical protein
MIAGCYVLHLYCRFAPESPQAIAKTGTFDARHYGTWFESSDVDTRAQANRQARRRGWRFGRDGDVTCPICVKHGPGIETVG